MPRGGDRAAHRVVLGDAQAAVLHSTELRPGDRVLDLRFPRRLAHGPDRPLLSVLDGCGIDCAAVAAGCTIDLRQLSRQLADGGEVDTRADNAAVLAGSDGRLVPFYFAKSAQTRCATTPSRRLAGPAVGSSANKRLSAATSPACMAVIPPPSRSNPRC